MPNLYRSMRKLDDKPEVCDVVDCLGVRVEGEHPDVFPEVDGQIVPGAGGMSVSVHDSRAIPRWRLPQRFGGENKNPLCTLWVMSADGLHADLVHREDEPRDDGAIHAQVEPRQPMQLVNFQTCLRSTQDVWTEVPPP